MKISLIITVFNGKKYIAKAIESFLAQDYSDKELIILDGKSQDGSHEIIAKYQQNYPNLIKWVKEQDRGISHARNIALQHVSGDLIGFLGADDFLHKNFYAELPYYIEANPDFEVLYFDSYTVGNDSSFDASSQTKMTKRNLIKHCPIGSGESFYYRRKVFDKFKFNEKNRYSMDYELNMALVESGEYNFFPINIVAVFNGCYGENISSASALKQRLESVAVQLKYSRNFKEKFKILFCKKKLILKNLPTFLAIKNNL